MLREIKADKCKLYNDDNIEIMDKLMEEGIQVDLTVTSPPYDDLRSYDGTLNWNFSVFKNVAQRLYNITKDGGVVVWVVGDKTEKGSESLTSFKQALYFKKIGFNLHDTMIYEKKNPFGTCGKGHKRYRQAFEYMFIFTKGKIKTFNPIKEECSDNGRKVKFTTRKNKQSDGKDFDAIRDGEMTVGNEKVLKNIWEYDTGYNRTTKDKIAFKHPAIFPEKLAEDHILSWSNEGDTVLDCFMGSNTTGKMSLLNNRKYIGIEKVEDYFNIAKERITNISIKD